MSPPYNPPDREQREQLTRFFMGSGTVGLRTQTEITLMPELEEKEDRAKLPMTKRTMEVFRLGRHEAEQMGRCEANSGHILLGLLLEGHGVAGYVLRGDPYVLNPQQIWDVVSNDRDETPDANHVPGMGLPLSEEGKAILADAHKEAIALGHRAVGPEHLLLSMTIHPDTVSGRALTFLCSRGPGADTPETVLPDIRTYVLELIDPDSDLRVRAEKDRQEAENADFRERSGTVQDDSPLVSFLYELMRDHLTPGKLEAMVRDCLHPQCTVYTNGYLAKYAQDLAKRLNAKPKHPEITSTKQ